MRADGQSDALYSTHTLEFVLLKGAMCLRASTGLDRGQGVVHVPVTWLCGNPSTRIDDFRHVVPALLGREQLGDVY